jgi:hypothetical protein
MGRMDFTIDDDVETAFRNSILSKRKGDLSKKVEELMKKDLKIKSGNTSAEEKKLKKLYSEIDKLVLNLYKAEELSMIGANKVAIEWDKIKLKMEKF